MTLSQTDGKEIAARADLSLVTVNRLANWHSKQIRKLPKDVAAAALGEQIDKLSRQYGAREKPDPETVRECLALVGTKFAYLAPDELREAYRMFAAGEIEHAAGEMYGGRMNARQLGAILTAYVDHRKYEMAAYLRAKHEMEEEREKAEKAEKAKRGFEESFLSELAQAVESCEDWREIPEYWYQSLKDRGMIEFTKEEAFQIYEDAGQLTILEENNRIKEKQETGNIFRDIAPRENIQKSIARKLTVFRKYILINRKTQDHE